MKVILSKRTRYEILLLKNNHGDAKEVLDELEML